MIRPWIGATVGGAIGAGIWAAIAYFAEIEIGWIAWGVGILVGLGAFKADPAAASVPTGVLAAGMALLAVAAGRYLAVTFSVQQEMSQLAAGEVDDVLAISYIADDVALEREEAGERLQWPASAPDEVPTEEADYPPDVWAEAEALWAGLGADGQGDFREELKQGFLQGAEAFAAEARREGFRSSLGPIDLLFAALAVVTAFKLASGSARASET